MLPKLVTRTVCSACGTDFSVGNLGSYGESWKTHLSWSQDLLREAESFQRRMEALVGQEFEVHFLDAYGYETYIKYRTQVLYVRPVCVEGPGCFDHRESLRPLLYLSAPLPGSTTPREFKGETVYSVDYIPDTSVTDPVTGSTSWTLQPCGKDNDHFESEYL